MVIFLRLKINKSIQLLPTSADKVTLFTFVTERRAAGNVAATAIDQYLLPAGPTSANPPHAAAAVNTWDRQTDIVLLHRLHTVRALSIKHVKRRMPSNKKVPKCKL